jgi:cellulose synthase/poly-beta-1,6-N-acetylglucosamine synthase-like glycosyltransferase
MHLTAAVGIMAYNEGSNIGALLDSILAQTCFANIDRVVVVASGCTDQTCQIVSAYAARNPKIELIEEPDRAGKTAAINKFLLSATEEIILISSGDLIYEPATVEQLLEPFAHPEIGMVGAHPIPLNRDDTFFGYASQLMWHLHHEVSMHDPKMGELIAFRNVFRRLNPTAISDELSVHQLIRSSGYTSVYAPKAVVYNKGPGRLDEFIAQRMRCISGNLQIMRDHNVPVSTMRTLPVIRAAVPYALRHWKRLHWTIATAALELYCRMRSQVVFRSQKKLRRYAVWEPAVSTKTLERRS